MPRFSLDTRRALCVLPLVAALGLAGSAQAAPLVASQTVSSELALRDAGFYAGPSADAGATRVGSSGTDALAGVTLHRGASGLAVRELQVALAWQGFPSGAIDGRFGSHLVGALQRFQRAAGIRADGVAGPATVALLRRSPAVPAIPLAWPLLAPVGDPFGPRGDRFHSGLDLLAPAGAPVAAAAPGRVVWAGPRDGGWGNLVTIAHAGGMRTMYAHLETISVRLGEWIAGGAEIGLVGSTGDATGPHLHFEVRLRGAAIDPLRALVPLATG